MKEDIQMPGQGNNSDLIKVSVVIPSYCLRKYIVECVDSIVRQKTDFDFEILVGDDASTDGTQEEIAKYVESLPGHLRQMVRLFFPSENKGLVGNLNDLFAHCRGQYIAYMDGDDLALPGKLQGQADYLDEHPNCAIVYHESEVFHSETGKVIRLYSRDFYNSRYIPQQAGIVHLVKYGTFLQASAVMFRHHGQLSRVLDPRCRIIVDYSMHMFNAYFGKGTIDRQDTIWGKYRVHEDSFGAQTSRSAERREAVLGELLVACDNALDMGVSQGEVQQGKAHFRYAAALYFLRMGRIDLFNFYIETSVDQEQFFDGKHEFIYRHRHSPQLILDAYELSS